MPDGRKRPSLDARDFWDRVAGGGRVGVPLGLLRMTVENLTYGSFGSE
ncbi:MAG: hypothetical protein RI897_1870 [Verrucomicrobiota bacterium]